MENKTEQEILKEVSEIIFPLTGKPDVLCREHQEEKAVVLCSKCSAGICWECLRKSDNPAELICLQCLAEASTGFSFLKYLKVLKFPALWVLLCIAFAGIAYGLGVGNPNLGEMEKKDKNDPWYRKDAGTILFAQASRERQRAAALRYLNRDAESEKWSLFAANSFAKCGEYWKKTPAEVNLKVAEALMIADAGDIDEAIELLSLMQETRTDQVYPVLHYHLGQLYLKKKDDKKADECFRNAWGSRPTGGLGIDTLLFDAANNMKEAEMMGKVRIICNTKWTPEMTQFCKKRLKIKDDPAGFLFLPEIKNTPKEIKKLKKNKPVKEEEVDFEIEFVK